MARINRGKWCGLSALTVSKMMNASHTSARELMRSLRATLGRELELNDIGELIQEYRNRQDTRYINKILTLCLAGLITMFTVTSCTSEFDKAPAIVYNDTILSHNYTPEYGLATGLLNIYVVYGEYKLADKDVPAGICLTPQGYRKYSIRDLLTANPTLATTEAIEESRRQDLKPIEVKE